MGDPTPQNISKEVPVVANYRLSMKIGKIGYAKPHAEYVLREGKYSKGHKKEDLQYKESGNMPNWALDNPVEFWETADYFEPVNGRTYREFEVALPNELSLEENIDLLNEFKDEMLGKDFAYTYAIHTSYNNGQMNTHAHFMFTERKNDGIERDKDTFFKRANPHYPERGGAKKERAWQKKGTLLHARKLFADITNKHLERSGELDRVDHRSNETQLQEALRSGDLNKVEYLTRYPVDIPGRLLNKVEKSLNEWEKKKISEYHVNRQIKREKEAIYKASLNKKAPLEKEDLILKIKKLDKKLDESSLNKSTLNSITNGNYYKYLNKTWELRKDIQKNPTNLELKKDLEEVRTQIQEIEEHLPGTSRYIAKYNALSKAYSNKRVAHLQELNDRYKIQETDLKEYQTEKDIHIIQENLDLSKLREKVDINNHLVIKDSLLKIQEKLAYLNTKSLDGEQVRNEAMDRVSGYKFSSLKTLYYSANLYSSKDKDFDNLKKQCAELYKGLEDPSIKSLITKESYKILDDIKKETEQLTLEKDILEKALTKTEIPSKVASNKHRVHRLINLRGEYESAKFNIERLKDKIIDVSTDKKLKPEEVEKRRSQYTKFINLGIEKAAILEKLVEKQEILIKDIPKTEIIQITREYRDKEVSRQASLEKGVDKLEKILKSSEEIKRFAINSLTRGKYKNLQERKATFEKALDPLLEKKQILENKIILTNGFMATLERRKYKKELQQLENRIKPYQDKYNALKSEENKLIQDLDSKFISLKTVELHKTFSNALQKAKGELVASKSKSFVSSDLERSTYKELPKRYYGHNQKHNSKALKEIDRLLKDDVTLSKGRNDLKNKIFKRGREEDVVELER